MAHDFSNMAKTLTRDGGFGEAGNVVNASGVRRPVQMTITRHPLAPADAQGTLHPLFTVGLIDSAILGATYSELDLGTWKLEFADHPGGSLLLHEISRHGVQNRGLIMLEIDGAGHTA